MIKKTIVCDKCKKEKEFSYKDAEDVTVFVSKRGSSCDFMDETHKDLCESCYRELQNLIVRWFRL